MIKRTSQFDTYIDFSIFGICLIISFYMISLNDETEDLKYLRNSYLEVSGSIQEKFSEVDNYFDLKQKNDSLKIELERLTEDNLKFKSAYFELLEIKKNLRIPLKDSTNRIFAEVIGEHFDLVRKQLVLNRGAKDSVRLNDPVVYKNGLVGKIVRVSEDFSVVKLATDHTIEVSVKILRLGEYGSIKWDAVRYFDLLYISKNVPVAVGDIIVTSGTSEIYPKDIKVGKVVQVENDVPGLFKEIKVLPEVNFSQLEYVMILNRLKHSKTDEILFNE